MSRTDVELLRQAVDAIQKAHDATKALIENDLPGINPYLARSSYGSYILLESLTEIVRARTVLAQIDNA